MDDGTARADDDDDVLTVFLDVVGLGNDVGGGLRKNVTKCYVVDFSLNATTKIPTLTQSKLKGVP